MLIDTNLLVPMTDANQNFSKVVRMVDRDGMAVILKNNQPKYVVVDFSEYDTDFCNRKYMRCFAETGWRRRIFAFFA